MSDSRQRFLDLMKKEILKLDLAELDFGIYRILNYRRAEIERFFDEELPATLDEALSHEGEERRKEMKAKLEELWDALDKAATALGFDSALVDDEIIEQLADSPIAAEYEVTRAALEALDDGAVFAESEEDRLYNVLYTFFSRYYRDGDFQPQQRRARNARYSVPYNGEDVHFHWRSKGSHYVKTTEELKSYTFRSGDWRVRFELLEAFQEPDNVKGNQRYFFPVPDECRQEVGKDGSLFVVPFAFRRLTEKEEKRYKKKSDELEGDSVQERILNDLAPSIDLPDGVARKDLVYHLHRYAKKNRTDYFVHPNLGPFLKAELDYFLKNEYLDIDGLTSVEAMADRLAKLRVLRKVANRIIDMLHEIESFQARLFEKRKFVLSNTYLVPIRMVPDDLWDAILENEAQIQQWRDDFALTGDVDYKTRGTHPTLVVDTSLFGAGFQTRLLASFDDVDEMTDGVLINSENFAALRTLTGALSGGVSCVYIDPPYNTGNDGFLYLDEFSRHSAWLSLMAGRLKACLPLLSQQGYVAVSIDQNEHHRLLELGVEIVGSVIATVVVQTNPKGRYLDRSIANSHDYIVILTTDPATELAGLPKDRDDIARDYPDSDSGGPYRLLELRNTHREFNRETRPNLWYPLYVNPADGSVSTSSSPGFVEVYPVWNDGLEGCWTWSSDLAERQVHLLVGRKVSGSWKVYRKSYATADDGSVVRYKPKSIWLDREVQTEVGQAELDGILGERVFRSPKPSRLIRNVLELDPSSRHTVVDFFAGSGTTGDAAIQIGRAGEARHVFVLVEMGEHFDPVLKRRIVKVMYAPGWKDGAPTEEPKFENGVPEWVERSPRLVQVIKLESYEDSLNSLTVGDDAQLGEELRIRYVIPDSVEKSPCFVATEKLEHPFDYQLEVHTEEGVEFVDVDLITTFNLIKGIRLKRYRELDHDGRRYVVVEGRENSEEVLVVWRDVGGLDPGAERSLLQEAIPEALGRDLDDYARVYHNADSALPNSVSLDAELKRLMFEPEAALA